MKKLVFLLFLSLTCLQVTQPASGQGAKIAPRYSINLDLPPKQRWSEVVKDYGEDFKGLLAMVKKYVPGEVLDLLAVVGLKVETVIPYPYNYEMMGISELIPGVSVADVLLGNVLYEVTAFSKRLNSKACTSIVAQASNGSIFHGRNLDYNMVGFLRNMTITVDFTRSGKTIYTGSTYAGYIGLLTGQKPHAYTISLDERDRGQFWMNALSALADGGKAVVSFHIRDALANEDFGYEDALIFLADKPLIAPSYIIIGGTRPDQGAVITRDRIAVLDFWKLDVARGRWYVLETNYDHWDPPPSDDNRRDPAMRAMNETGAANVGVSGLFDVLSTAPVLNDGTTYTVVMSAAYPELYTTWIRNV